MVTLDQDSVVTKEYIDAVFEYMNLYVGKQITFCPQIYCGGRQISPFSFDATGSPRYGNAGQLYAINSFSIHSVSSLATLDIIDEFYWLDALDFVIFEKLHRAGITIVELPVQVQHNLSLLQGGVRQERLANIAFYEAAFLFEYCGPIRLLSGLVRLIARAVRRIDFVRQGNVFCYSLVNHFGIHQRPY